MRTDKVHPHIDNSSESVLRDTDTNTIDDRVTRFWKAYSTEAGDYDDHLLQQTRDSMEGIMLFTGLFSAVSATFLVAMQSKLQPDPADTTNALLMMLVHANNKSAIMDQNISLPVWNGPSSLVVWSQALGYVALSATLLAALSAVFVKQWLSGYTQLEIGPLWERCRRRQQKLESLRAWRFELVISGLFTLIQLALLLFSVALAMTLWEVNRVVGAVFTASTAIGVFLYLFITLASLFFPACPYQTPVSSAICGIIGGVMKSAEEVTEYWVWCTDKHNQRKRPMIGRGNTLVAYTVGVLCYSLLATVFAIHLVLLAVLILLVLLVTWVRGGRGNNFRTRMDSYRSAFNLTTLKSRFRSSTYWMHDSVRCARNYIRRAYLEPELDSGNPRAIAWILETSTNPDSLMVAAELVPDATWPENQNLDMSIPTECLYNTFIRLLPERSSGRALRLGRALVKMLCQTSNLKEISTHVWREALRHLTEQSEMLDPDSDSDLLFILTIIIKLLNLKLGFPNYVVELPVNCEVSQPLLSWFLQPLEVLLVLECPRQSSFLPEAYRTFLKLKWPGDSALEGSQGLQYLRTFEIYFNTVVGAHIERSENPVEHSPPCVTSYSGPTCNADFLQRILEKLTQIDPSRLPEVHLHLIKPLAILSRLASVSYMQQAFKDASISSWMIKAFNETAGKAGGSGDSLFVFAGCIMSLIMVIDSFNPENTQAENPVMDGDPHGQTHMLPVRMNSRGLLSFLLNKESPATSEQLVYALQIILANVDDLPELISNPEFVNYILYATSPGQVRPVQDIGSKVLTVACKYLMLSYDTQNLARLATQCNLACFLRRGILTEDPPTILGDLLRNNDEKFNADQLRVLAPALDNSFDRLLIEFNNEPHKIPVSELRDLEITLVLSNMENRKRLMYDRLDHCIALIPLHNYKCTMALPLAVIVGWLLRRDGPIVSAAPNEGVWKAFIRPNFEELLFSAWGDADTLEENPQMLRLLLDCMGQWLSTFVKFRTGSGSNSSSSQPSPSTLRRLDGALDQMRSASQYLSFHIKRSLVKLSDEIKQYLPEKE